ncbi:hypothetical protein BB559_001447 [Furculomyces boomerangus]|uniref:Uncharacterized protein n=2 Tax=Harpellales TaxID=61421 RepID=A0A2T9Z225_9FUNG|nr:hypothetical protein BB559_001447 [Furculomyces boomerangus]PWA03558.1 hypothetical protein BB558_000246 [Smittium angustum]
MFLQKLYSKNHFRSIFPHSSKYSSSTKTKPAFDVFVTKAKLLEYFQNNGIDTKKKLVQRYDAQTLLTKKNLDRRINLGIKIKHDIFQDPISPQLSKQLLDEADAVVEEECSYLLKKLKDHKASTAIDSDNDDRLKILANKIRATYKYRVTTKQKGLFKNINEPAEKDLSTESNSKTPEIQKIQAMTEELKKAALDFLMSAKPIPPK